VQVAAQLLAQLAATLRDGLAAGGRQPAEVHRLFPRGGLGDRGRRDGTDALQLLQGAVAQPRVELLRGQLPDHSGGRAEGPDPVGGLVRAFEQERDAVERLRCRVLAHPPDATFPSCPGVTSSPSTRARPAARPSSSTARRAWWAADTPSSPSTTRGRAGWSTTRRISGRSRSTSRRRRWRTPAAPSTTSPRSASPIS